MKGGGEGGCCNLKLLGGGGGGGLDGWGGRGCSLKLPEVLGGWDWGLLLVGWGGGGVGASSGAFKKRGAAGMSDVFLLSGVSGLSF